MSWQHVSSLDMALTAADLPCTSVSSRFLPSELEKPAVVSVCRATSIGHILSEYLCNLTPAVSGVAHLLQPLFFGRSPWSVGSSTLFAAILIHQR
jgi:hypothetical protein